MTEEGMRPDPDELVRVVKKARGVVSWFTVPQAAVGLAEAMTDALALIGSLLAVEDEAPEVIECGDLAIDVGRRQATRGGTLIRMGEIEHELLVALVRRAGRLCTYDTLIEALWPDSPPDPTRARKNVNMHVLRLRGAVGDDAILTVASAGYLFRAPEPDETAGRTPEPGLDLDDRIRSPEREAFAAATEARNRALDVVREDSRAAIRVLAKGLADLVNAIALAITARTRRAEGSGVGDPAADAALAQAVVAPAEARNRIQDDPPAAIVALATGLVAALRASAPLRSLPKRRRPRVLGDVTVDLDEETVTRNGTLVRLPRTAFMILAVLAERPGYALTRQTLCERVWGGPEPSPNTFNTHILRLDSVLGVDIVQDIGRFGYRSRPEGPETRDRRRR